MRAKTLRTLLSSAVREALVRHAQDAFAEYRSTDLHKDGRRPFLVQIDGIAVTVEPHDIEAFLTDLESLLPSPSTPAQGQP